MGNYAVVGYGLPYENPDDIAVANLMWSLVLSRLAGSSGTGPDLRPLVGQLYLQGGVVWFYGGNVGAGDASSLDVIRQKVQQQIARLTEEKLDPGELTTMLKAMPPRVDAKASAPLSLQDAWIEGLKHIPGIPVQPLADLANSPPSDLAELVSLMAKRISTNSPTSLLVNGTKREAPGSQNYLLVGLGCAGLAIWAAARKRRYSVKK